MFFGIYMITVADPQILWNDGFYPLVDVTIPDGSLLEAEATRPRCTRRNHGIGRVFDLFGGLLGQTNPALLNAAGLLLLAALHVLRALHRRATARASGSSCTRSASAASPAGRSATGRTGTRCGRSFVNIPCEYLESYYPLRIEKWETVADTGGAGLHRGGNGVDVAYRFLEPGDDRDPRRPLADLPVGRQRRRAGRARHASGSSGPTARREVLPSKCHDVPVAAGRRAALRHLGRRRLGRPARARPGAGRRWRSGAGWSPPTAPAGTASCVDERRRASTPTATEALRDRDARRPARRAAGLRHGPAARGAAGALRGGDRAARAEAAGLGRVTAGPARRRRSPAGSGWGRGGPARRWSSTWCAPTPTRRARSAARPRARRSRRPQALVDAARAHGRPVRLDGRALRPRPRRRRPVRAQGARARLLRRGRRRRLGRARAGARRGRAGDRQAVRHRRSSAPRWPSTLHAAGVDTVVVAGVSTSGCIRATATDALNHGFRPLVVRDACADRTPGAARATTCADLDAKYADVVDLDEALAHLRG